MAATDRVLLHVPEPRAAVPRTFSRPRPALARRQAEATKRRYHESSEATPAKRRSEASCLPAKKTAAKETQGTFQGKALKTFSPKKSSAGGSNRNQERKPGIKTSSLFKNNPEIPELHRPVVKQVQEKVFTSDAFHKLDLHPHLISTINSVLKMSSMTSVQKQSIPVLLEGRDALVRSQTGSGKTLAYCIPVVQSLQAMESKIQRADGPYALILVPTRELALQSFETVQKLLKPFTWIVPGVLMGGEKRKSEKARLRKGINILISTPGRLVDHIKSTKNIHFSRIRWLILDEADRILDLGFEKDITVILNAVNAECQGRQNVLLSATLTEGVTRLADISLHNPVSISVPDESHDPKSRAVLEASAPRTGSELDSFAIPAGLDQHVTVVPSKLRLVSLAAFILQKCKFERDQKMVVFFLSCELVEFHYNLFLQTLLGGSGAPALGRLPSASMQFGFLRLHGDMEQEERTAVFQEFSRSKTGVLLCTDVAARGLDLPQVTWIVQYNAPASPAEYIHRIGRTARIGCRGSSLLILAPSEAEYVNSLASHKINVSEIKMEDILSVLTKDDCFKRRRRGNQKSHAVGPQEIRERATVLQTVFEDYVHSSERTVSGAKKALQSFIRAYAAYPRELKHIFHVRFLHLGHVAKSFGLRDAPKNLSALSVKKKKANLKRPDLQRRTQSRHRLAEILLSEYSSGMETSVAKVKKQSECAGPGSQRPASAVGKNEAQKPY
ncbi:probable ATP-dependent RNA helicase DDX31 isoform X1 [Camelus dromedarius]|uniref:probable ATP-dependent RNA helicase DDX31 isoform X1 n=1 Tax=Camelus dromedarius TaxID=9838 RepID=UPI001263516A|nr:probable ATP-dependent RNA helicase DDX31 isoform X1 [Camelus dromedarius]